MNDMTIPTVECERVKWNGLWRWRVIRCPFCGKRKAHIHGADNFVGETKKNTLGRRIPHCRKEQKPRGAEYVLTDAKAKKEIRNG